MTPEEIMKIAEEYVNEYAPSNMDEGIRKGLVQSAIFLYGWLTRCFYLVEKGKAKKLCELAVNESSSIDYALIGGRLASKPKNEVECALFALARGLPCSVKRPLPPRIREIHIYGPA